MYINEPMKEFKMHRKSESRIVHLIDLVVV